jgi:hypothetical protein
MDITTAYAGIVKHERDTNGDLLVYGRATSADLDLDQQVCDPAWLAKAMPQWFSTGANVREQHSSIAAGVGTELEQDGTAWNLKSRVVDPVSARKVEAGVLKGYSVGIRAPRVVKDAAAPGGRIVDGQIVEVSLVDRPANPTCTLMLAKALKPGMPAVPLADFDADRMLVRVEELVEKRDFSTAQRDAAASSGAAMPDGSFPIKTVQDLRNAIHAIGRAKDPDAAKAHIKARAKALGKTDLLPDSWKAAAPGMWVHDPHQIGTVRDGLVALIRAELDELTGGENELADVSNLMNALCLLMCWWDHEADEGETANPYPHGNQEASMAATIGMAAQATTPPAAPDTAKAAPAAPPAVPAPPASETPAPEAGKAVEGAAQNDLTELVKAAVAEALTPIKAQLAKAMEQPAPGGPVLTRTSEDTAKAAGRERLLTKAAEYDRSAMELSHDPQARAAYLQKAAELRTQAATS